MRRSTHALLALTLCSVLTTPGVAQVVTGRVVNAATDSALVDVELELLMPDGRRVARAVSDTAGRFSLQTPRFGEFLLTASMLGMEQVRTQPFDVGPGSMEVVVRMAATAVPLEPLTVEARGRRADLGFLSGYYERMEWNQRLGVGRFITRDVIDRRNPIDMSDMLREMPRVNVHRTRGSSNFVTMRGTGGECTPALYIDGARANRRERAYLDDMVRPGDVEGMEVYVGPAQLPGAYHDETGCGVLLVWTRRGTSDGRPFSWRRALVALGAVGGFLLIVR